MLKGPARVPALFAWDDRVNPAFARTPRIARGFREKVISPSIIPPYAGAQCAHLPPMRKLDGPHDTLALQTNARAFGQRRNPGASGMSGIAFAQTAPEATVPGAAPLTPPAASQTAPAPAAPQATPPIGAVVPTSGPASVADLAEGLLDAVVNISTSQNVKDDEGVGPAPRARMDRPSRSFLTTSSIKSRATKAPTTMSARSAPVSSSIRPATSSPTTT